MPCSFAVSISETIVANRKRPPQLRQPYLSLPAVVDGRLGAIPTHVAAGFFIRPLPRHSALPPPDLPNFQLPVPRLGETRAVARLSSIVRDRMRPLLL